MNDEHRTHVTFHYDNGTTYTARNISYFDIDEEENLIHYEYLRQSTKGNGTVLETAAVFVTVKAQDIHTLVLKEGPDYIVKRLKESSVVDIMATTRKETNQAFNFPTFDFGEPPFGRIWVDYEVQFHEQNT